MTTETVDRSPCYLHDDDNRPCTQCIEVLKQSVRIGRQYLTEIAEGEFNDAGVMTIPVAEPLQGRTFKSIAEVALRAMR